MNDTQQEKTQALTGLLKRIEVGDNLKSLCAEARQLSQQVAPEDIARAEQILVNNGYAQQVAHQLSTVFLFMGMYDQQQLKRQGRLSDNHLLQRITIEHDLYRCFNADLRDVTETIMHLEDLSDVSTEFRALTDVIRHLQALDEHMARESDMIFPYVRQQGYAPLTQAVEKDHQQIRCHMENLWALVLSFNGITLAEFQLRLSTTVQQLCPLLEEHLAFEDELLYPMALVLIDDTNTWETIKALCEQIGYGGARI